MIQCRKKRYSTLSKAYSAQHGDDYKVYYCKECDFYHCVKQQQPNNLGEKNAE